MFGALSAPGTKKNRLRRRSMEHVKQRPAVKRGRLHTAIDSTPQKLVTSGDVLCRPSTGKPAACPELRRSPLSPTAAPGLPTGTDESRSLYLSAIQFSRLSIAPGSAAVNRFFASAEIFSKISENPAAVPYDSVGNGDGNYWKGRSAEPAANAPSVRQLYAQFLRFSAPAWYTLKEKTTAGRARPLCAAQFNTRSRLSHEQNHR